MLFLYVIRLFSNSKFSSTVSLPALWKKLFRAHFSCKTPFPLRTLFKLVLLFIYTCSGSTIWTVSETVLDLAACKIPDVVPISRCTNGVSNFSLIILSKKKSGFFARANGFIFFTFTVLLKLVIIADLSGIVNRGVPCYKGRALDYKARVGGFNNPGTTNTEGLKMTEK